MPTLAFLSLLACSMAGSWDAPTDAPVVDTSSRLDSGDSSAYDSSDTAQPAMFHLVISEIMPDPDAVSDDVGEWFEVMNTGTTGVDMDGVKVEDENGGGFTIKGALPLGAGERLLFAASGDASANGGLTPDYAYSTDDLKLSNEGGTIGLYDGDTLIDAVVRDGMPLEKGHSLTLDPASTDPAADDEATNWCVSETPLTDGDYGTPGAANESCPKAAPDADGDGVPDADDCDPNDPTVYAGAPELPDGKDNDCDGVVDERAPALGDLVITEIMDDPDPTDDSDGEWFEIVSLAADPVVLFGLTVQDDSGEAFTVDTVDPGTIIEPGDIVLFGDSADSSKNGGIVPDVLFDHSVFHLDNDKDEILLGYGGILVDKVDYDSSFPQKKGRSRSLDPASTSESANDDGANWCEGQSDYGTDGDQGTPGLPNDPC